MFSLRSFTRWIHEKWIYLALLVVVIVPLLYMAASLAIRSGLFTVSDAAPSTDQLQIFMAFIGGGLATSATFIATLLTSQHNKREQGRLQVETVVNGLQSLPEGEQRVAGSIATMVLLGQQGVAMRVLDPAWRERKVDDATATWLIGQVLCGDRWDENAIAEGSTLLLKHAGKLTDPNHKGYVCWPGYFFEDWKSDLPQKAKCNILRAMAETLLSQKKNW